MPEAQFFSLLSVVFMMGFVLCFDRTHWRHKHGWQFANLMTQDELQRVSRILAASQDDEDSCWVLQRKL